MRAGRNDPNFTIQYYFITCTTTQSFLQEPNYARAKKKMMTSSYVELPGFFGERRIMKQSTSGVAKGRLKINDHDLLAGFTHA